MSQSVLPTESRSSRFLAPAGRVVAAARVLLVSTFKINFVSSSETGSNLKKMRTHSCSCRLLQNKKQRAFWGSSWSVEFLILGSGGSPVPSPVPPCSRSQESLLWRQPLGVGSYINTFARVSLVAVLLSRLVPAAFGGNRLVNQWIKPTDNLQEIPPDRRPHRDLPSRLEEKWNNGFFKVKICCAGARLTHKCSVIPARLIALLSRRCQFLPEERRPGWY